MKKLSIDIQIFSKIVEGNYIYVDKTKEFLNLIENYEYVFLSCLRRFGKSLFMDTLKEIFEGNKELYLVGMNFDVEKNNISRFVWEKWEDFNI
jgi:hypothetical protein